MNVRFDNLQINARVVNSNMFDNMYNNVWLSSYTVHTFNKIDHNLHFNQFTIVCVPAKHTECINP